MTIRILLADDHEIVREGFRSLLDNESDFEVIGEAGDGAEAARLARELAPNVIVMDVNMPGMDGVDATRLIASEVPNVKVVALSMYPKKSFVTGMLEAGASAYVLKNRPFSELATAVRTVMGDELYLCPKSAEIVVNDYMQTRPARSGSRESPLADRERRILKLLAEGKTSKEIALIIDMSVKTVDASRREMMKKIGVQSVAELVKYAIREDLTTLDI